MRNAMRLDPDTSTAGGGDVLDQLEQDHRQVEQLFARVSLTVGDERQALLPEIVQALTLHSEIEEDVVYPAIEDAVGGGDVLAQRAEDDHREIKELLARLETDDGAELVDDLRALQLVVQAHVAVEEAELFPAYRSVATADKLNELTQAADKVRSRA